MGLFDKLFGAIKKGSSIEPPKNGNYTLTDNLMDEEIFWNIIKTTKDNSNGDFEEQQEELAKELRKLTPDEIILFGNRFRYFRGQANTWELWGAIYIIHGGCGDDSFNDFREWVIGQDLDADTINEIGWEGLGYVYSTVFKELTGQEMEYTYRENHETTGQEWEEENDDLNNMFPKLYDKYKDYYN
ncbi:unnamed protein product [Rotaria sp. Silwood1]|nr:unnamed protein product [Rotaria sp. Silwood1]